MPDFDTFSLGFVRFASAAIFALGAYLCYRRWVETRRGLWRVVGILATVLAAYRLFVWITFSLIGGERALRLADESTWLANIAFIACALVVCYACARSKSEEERGR